MNKVEDHLIAAPEEQKLLDRPAEERLREQLDAQKKQQDDKKKPEEEKPIQPPAKVLWLIGLGILVVLLLVFFLGYLPRHRREKEIRSEAKFEKDALPIAYVVKVQKSPAMTELLLPGNITPLQEASLYARASGYVKKRYVDIGDRVREGQLMAELEAPELDQQVAQARAALAQAEAQARQTRADLETSKANLDLATVTYNRYRVLVEHGVLSKQEGDQQAANLRTAQANERAAEETVQGSEENVRAARANLERVIALQAFKFIRAPFSGVVTARNFDVGTLISGNGAGLGSGVNFQPSGGAGSSGGATSSSGSSQSSGGGGGSTSATGGGSGELFRVAQIGTLRILINVPQGNAPSIKPGQQADLLVQEFASEHFQGRVTRTSNSIDLASRTLLAEVQVGNATGKLLPGMYAQVQMKNMRSSPPLLIPGDSIVTRAGGTFVAMLEDPTGEDKKQEEKRDQEIKADEKDLKSSDQKTAEKQQEIPAKKVHLQRIEIGRDYGTETEVTGGLKGNEYLVVNPGDQIREGAMVRPSASSLKTPKPTNPGGPSDKRPSTISSPGEAALSQTKGATGGGGQQGANGGGQQGGNGGQQSQGKK